MGMIKYSSQTRYKLSVNSTLEPDADSSHTVHATQLNLSNTTTNSPMIVGSGDAGS